MIYTLWPEKGVGRLENTPVAEISKNPKGWWWRRRIFVLEWGKICVDIFQPVTFRGGDKTATNVDITLFRDSQETVAKSRLSGRTPFHLNDIKLEFCAKILPSKN